MLEEGIPVMQTNMETENKQGKKKKLKRADLSM